MRRNYNTPASAVRWIPLAERALIARGRFDRLDHGHVLPHDPRHHRVKVLADERAVEGDVVRKPAEDGYMVLGLWRRRFTHVPIPLAVSSRKSEHRRSVMAGHPRRHRPAPRHEIAHRGCARSALMTAVTAVMSERWVNACGKLPSCRPVRGSISSA